jgi:hypothetical protein
MGRGEVDCEPFELISQTGQVAIHPITALQSFPLDHDEPPTSAQSQLKTRRSQRMPSPIAKSKLANCGLILRL